MPLVKRLDLKGMLLSEIRELLEKLGEPTYRSDQIFDWIHKKRIVDIEEMTNLPKSLRGSLTTVARVCNLDKKAIHVSKSGEAVKFIFETPNGYLIESVLLISGTRRTVCLSSQIGCPLDCKFCATGSMGMIGNLTTGEIIDQLLQIEKYVTEKGERITNVVMMGMGEPLLNYNSVIKALALMRSKGGIGLGGRKITVSTAGYVPGIHKLARSDLNVGLAISLNATTDEMRERIMPINSRFKITDLITAAEYFFSLRGYGVTFEYVLMSHLTDRIEDAERLALLTANVPCKINLIPYNEVQELSKFKRPSNTRLLAFYKTLKKAGADYTIRESGGRDIDAACGQLVQKS